MSADEPDRSLSERFADFLDGLGLENLTDDYREHKREVDGALESTFESGPAAIAGTPELVEVDKVNVHRDGGDILVPVVPVVFEAAGEPPRELVWEITGDVFSAVYPVFRNEHVRQYDVQFAYASADESEAIFRRITAGETLVDEFVTDATIGTETLRERIQQGDDGDDGVPPVYWQEFDAKSPAGSGAYAGPAPIYQAAKYASESSVSDCLSDDDVVYYTGAAGF